MRAVLAAFVAASLCACAVQPAAPPSAPSRLQAVGYDALPGWRQDETASVLPGLLAQCRRLGQLPADQALGGDAETASGGQAGRWTAPCATLRALPPGDDAAARRAIEARFHPYQVAAPALVTGYFEPVIAGSQTPGGAYTVKLLARPDDLVEQPAADPNAPPVLGRMAGGKLVPYWTRAEIEHGAAAGHARVLLWLTSRADLFFLQIQGSGRVRLPGGTMLRVVYAGRNGRPYTPIGRVLVAGGQLPASGVTMETIRAWLDAHPGQADAVMDLNASYGFFRLSTAASAEGPPGALGVALVPGRSVAVDRHYVPLGSLMWLDTTYPLGGAPFQHLVLAQDLGTNIAGPGRVDLFLGAGGSAALWASRMHQNGAVYLLLP